MTSADLSVARMDEPNDDFGFDDVVEGTQYDGYVADVRRDFHQELYQDQEGINRITDAIRTLVDVNVPHDSGRYRPTRANISILIKNRHNNRQWNFTQRVGWFALTNGIEPFLREIEETLKMLFDNEYYDRTILNVKMQMYSLQDLQ